MPRKKAKAGVVGGKPRHIHRDRESLDEGLPLPSPNPNPNSTMPQEPHPQVQDEAAEAPTFPPGPPESGGEVAGGAEAEQEMEEDPQAIAAVFPHPPPDVATVPDLPAPPNPPPPATAARKPPGKRKKPFTGKQLAAVREKLALLNNNFRPVPFVPAKTLDLARHEALLRALGLWDFAHLQFDSEIRSDLLALLIANYDPPNRRSFVGDVRISVSRADLARALMLTVKKGGGAGGAGGSEGGESAPQELVSGEDAAAVIVEFMSSYMLFQEDACILPSEFVTATQWVKEGQIQKVDWAGLMWAFVEKELLEAPKLGLCCYASHLQCLMKHQHPRLFEEAAEPKPELVLEPEVKPEREPEPEPEPEPSMDVAMAEEEDDAQDGDTTNRSLEDIQDAGHEKQGPGLSLGLGGDADIMDSLEEYKEGAEHWLPEGKSEGVGHCLVRSSSNGVTSMEFENLSKVGVEREEERYVDDLSTKFPSLDRLTSTDLLQAMETAQASYSLPMNSLDPSSGEFLAMKADAHKNMSMDLSPGGSFYFGNNGKRHVGEINDDDDDNDIHRFSQNHQQKRMRSNGLWEHASSEFDACLEQVQASVGKAKMLFVEKEQAVVNAQLDLQYMNELLQQKDQIIQSLERTRVEDQQKWRLQVCHFEHELNVMANLVVGYKKALKETRITFAEYRKRFPQGDEPLYHDVEGTGGLVLSTMELERRRLEKEEQMRHVAEELINDFSNEWFPKIDDYRSRLLVLTSKMDSLAEEIKHLREQRAKVKTSHA